MSDGAEQARQAGPTRLEEERPAGGRLPIVPSAHCSQGPTFSACPCGLEPGGRGRKEMTYGHQLNGLMDCLSLRQKEPGHRGKKASTLQT